MGTGVLGHAVRSKNRLDTVGPTGPSNAVLKQGIHQRPSSGLPPCFRISKAPPFRPLTAQIGWVAQIPDLRFRHLYSLLPRLHASDRVDAAPWLFERSRVWEGIMLPSFHGASFAAAYHSHSFGSTNTRHVPPSSFCSRCCYCSTLLGELMQRGGFSQGTANAKSLLFAPDSGMGWTRQRLDFFNLYGPLLERFNREPGRALKPIVSSYNCWRFSIYITAAARACPETYWQSDGPQPHLDNVHFRRKTTIHGICIYADYKLDESYTPSRAAVSLGSSFHDLQEQEAKDLREPTGWVPIATRDAAGHTVGVFLVETAVLSNHENGRDTHLRQIKANRPAPEPPRRLRFGHILFELAGLHKYQTSTADICSLCCHGCMLLDELMRRHDFSKQTPAEKSVLLASDSGMAWDGGWARHLAFEAFS
ncbi:hypothetical protein HPB50_028302 [Hyalomma asiaticum]|nr:hypothetical protein HPB50_028302 [Hyalomma asiaticum]